MSADEVNAKPSRRHLLPPFGFRLLQHMSGRSCDALPRDLAPEMTELLGRPVSVAQVFVTLERLKSQGYVTSVTGRPESAQGMRRVRRVRMFSLEPAGIEALRTTAAAYETSGAHR